MLPRRSANPGKGVCIYLHGPHLAFLRTIHAKPGVAIRQLIDQTIQSLPPLQEPEIVALCQRCERFGFPACPKCKAAFYGPPAAATAPSPQLSAG
jgi:hypothetical protein